MTKRRISHWIASALGCLLCLCSAPATAESRALLIGVGEYQDSGSNLPGIDLDISIMKKIAGRLGYRDSQITVLMNSEVTSANIVRAFKEIALKAGENDKVLIYYSGHGTQIPDQPGGDEDDNYDEALTLYNLGSGPDYGLLRDDDIRGLLEVLPSKHKTLLVDACCSGSAVKSLRLDQSAYPDGTDFYVKSRQCAGGQSKSFGVEEGAALENIVYLSAAQDDQFSLASREGSIFTLALQDAFREGANISAKQLQAQTDAYVARRVSPQRRFNPNLLGDASHFNDKSWFAVSQQQAMQSADRPSQLRDWSRLVNEADGPIALRTGQSSYSEGEYLKLSIDMPFDGYLNLVVIDPEDRVLLLYPNGLAQNNRVARGKLGLPLREFRWPARPPHGTNHLAVIATQEPLNLFQSSHNRNAKGEALENYLVPTDAGMERIRKNLSKRGNGSGYHANIVPVRTCASGC